MSSISLVTGNTCPAGYTYISSWPACRAALSAYSSSLPPDGSSTIFGYDFKGTEKEASWPKGCYHCENVNGCSDGAYYNTDATGAANAGAQVMCGKVDDFEPTMQEQMLFVGDSDIDYWTGVEINDNLGNVTTQKFNVGLGGYTCKNVKNEVASFLDVFAPSQVVLVCGENDLFERSVAKTFEYFQEVVQSYIAGGVEMVYAFSTKPEPDSTNLHSKYKKLDALIVNWIKTDEAIDGKFVFIDSYGGFEDVGNPTDLYQSDRLHLSAKGYQYWEQWLTTALDDNENASSCRVWRSGRCLSTQTGFYDVPEGELNSCFSAHTTVRVQGGATKTMNHVVVGDNVLTGTGKYETIYAIDHSHPTKETTFIQIYAATNDQQGQEQPIEITIKHLVFVVSSTTDSNIPIPMTADTIKVGDTLMTLQGPRSVSKISSIVRNGLYNILTESGTIIVNDMGVLVSTYSVPFLFPSSAAVTAVVAKTVQQQQQQQQRQREEATNYQQLFQHVLKPYRWFCTNISLELCQVPKKEQAGGKYGNKDHGEKLFLIDFVAKLMTLMVQKLSLSSSPLIYYVLLSLLSNYLFLIFTVSSLVFYLTSKIFSVIRIHDTNRRQEAK